jgi:cytochrome c oxidase subunit 2
VANNLGSESEKRARVNNVEKRVLLGAVLFVGLSLGLIAYATWGLGINVPTCVPASQGFEHASITKHDGKNYEVHYVARMWTFEPAVLRVPTGSTLDLYVVSKDVTHGLEIAGTNINLMVVPGAIANGRVHFEKPGTHLILCHEYCGKAHQNMNARIEVSNDVSDVSAEGLGDTGAGENKLLTEKGCVLCHSIDGTPGLGPTLKGAWGTTIELADGTKHVIDAEFLKEKLRHPANNILKGYQPLMPELPLTDQEIEQIAEYLRDLK